MGHWIDLTVHVFNWRKKLPKIIHISIKYAKDEEFDDNLVVIFTTDLNDLVTIVLTARTEPFEGIFESINFQSSGLIANINDFRKMTIWNESKKIKRKYFPKDVGHEKSITRFWSKTSRSWDEVILSSLIMLKVSDMVRLNESIFCFDIINEIDNFYSKVQNFDNL